MAAGTMPVCSDDTGWFNRYPTVVCITPRSTTASASCLLKWKQNALTCNQRNLNDKNVIYYKTFIQYICNLYIVHRPSRTKIRIFIAVLYHVRCPRLNCEWWKGEEQKLFHYKGSLYLSNYSSKLMIMQRLKEGEAKPFILLWSAKPATILHGQ